MQDIYFRCDTVPPTEDNPAECDEIPYPLVEKVANKRFNISILPITMLSIITYSNMKTCGNKYNK